MKVPSNAVGLFLIAACAGCSDAESSTCETFGETLQVALETSFADENRIGGTVAGVLTSSCRWVGATGESEPGVPLTPSSVMRVGSVTKTYVAASLLALASQGVLSLDDTLINHIATGLPNEESITIRQLLNHTAGVYNYTNNIAYMTQLLQNPTTPVSPQDMIDVAIAQGADFAPGTDWNYSNTGYIILGLVLEAVSGKTAGIHIRTQILEPNMLSRTFLDGEEVLPESLAIGWEADQDVTHAIHPSAPWTAGSMVAEVGDLIEWARALYAGEAIDQAARNEMFTFTSESQSSYGLGVSTAMVPDVGTIVGHGGGIPGFLTAMFYVQDVDVAVAVIVNNSVGDPNRAWNALAKLAVGRSS